MGKAQFKTLEASLAAIFLVTFLAWFFSLALKVPEIESLDVRLGILRALKVLDKNNELRSYVYLNDTQTIEQKLFFAVPKKFDYKVLICEGYCSYEVEAEVVYSISYFLSNDLKNFGNREVLVYVWEA